MLACGRLGIALVLCVSMLTLVKNVVTCGDRDGIYLNADGDSSHGVHPLGTMNICTKLLGQLCNSW